MAARQARSGTRDWPLAASVEPEAQPARPRIEQRERPQPRIARRERIRPRIGQQEQARPMTARQEQARPMTELLVQSPVVRVAPVKGLVQRLKLENLLEPGCEVEAGR